MGKPSWVSIAAWIALVAIVIYLVFVATHKEDTIDNYAKGANHTEYTISENNILPRCGQMFSILEKGTTIPQKAVK